MHPPVFHRTAKVCEGPGDILVFLTGEQEIEDACRKIKAECDGMGAQVGEIVVLPLYSTLPMDRQRLIFEPAPAPRRPGGPAGRKVRTAPHRTAPPPS